MKLTIGNDRDTAAAIESWGARHVDCKVEEIAVDERLKIVSTPAYMLGPWIAPVAAGIDKLVSAVLEMADGGFLPGMRRDSQTGRLATASARRTFFLAPVEFRVESRVSQAGGLGRPHDSGAQHVTKTFAALFVAVAVAFAPTAVAADAAGRADHPPGQAGQRDLQPQDAHARLKCTQCHADEKGGAIEGFGKTVNKDKAHAACHECHKKEAKGPQKCADCHKK